MQTYERRLQTDCEDWLKKNYSRLYNSSFLVSDKSFTDSTPRCYTSFIAKHPNCHLNCQVGPWKSLHIKFKAPGDFLTSEEKHTIALLREQECRVIIVRYLEDFKTLMDLYLDRQVIKI